MRVGILDILTTPARSWAEAAYKLALTKQYASVFPQAIAVWCREMGHRTFYATYYGAGDPKRSLPDDLDVVFIAVYTQASALAYALAKLYRREGVLTVIGGPHAKAFPTDCLRYFDVVVREGDKPLIADILKGVYDPGTIVSSSKPLEDLPTVEERERFIRSTIGTRDHAAFSDFDAPTLARLTAGISLTDLAVLVKLAMETGQRLNAKQFNDLKKRLIEKQAQGLLEFIEPKWTLDTVVGHEAAKTRLREDAELLRKGRLASVPMGYLLCGAVGTGKTFLAQCAAGEIGIPCVILKNFRSKYVGETEGNLERVLSVLRAMGPVMVVIDEADAALGSREAEGDSGTSSRVFGMIANQMGDTRYRGMILWMLLTARPDLLPIDLKRQGRAEVHIPLFYPTDADEIKQMFVTLAKKLKGTLAAEDIPSVPHVGQLSGADVEGMVGRALRISLLAGSETITRDALAQVFAEFMPSTQGIEKEMQELAAILECSDRQFLPPALAKQMDGDGRARTQQRFLELRRLMEIS